MTSIGQKMYKEALKLEGLHERTNKKRLTKFIRQAHEMDITKTAWCAALVNALLERQGIEGTGKLTARSLLNVGTSVKNPRLGDIVVIKRGLLPWQGHVGLYAGQTETHIIILGGNQSNMVCKKTYKKNRLLGYRRV